MKILFLADMDSLHTKRWVNYLVEKGYEVYVLGQFIDKKDSYKDYNDHRVPITATIGKRLMLEYKWIEWVYLRLVKYHLVPSTIRHYIGIILQLRIVYQLKKEIKPDIIHNHYISSEGFAAALIGFHPLILSAWGSDIFNTKKETTHRKELRYSLNKADCITTTSIHMREYLLSKYNLDPRKVVTIPWGIDLRLFKRGYKDKVSVLEKNLNIGEEISVIISTRHMAPQYQIKSIIEAIPYVIRECPNTMFVFIRGNGTEHFESEMKLLAMALGVWSHIIFISKSITPEEMAIYLNMSDILISIPQNDQFGASILEGMVCSVIPIVSRIEVYKQFLIDGYNAFLVNPEDPQEIAQKTIYCINHPELKEKFYQINKKIVEEEEDWQKNAPKMEQLYKNMLTKKLKRH